MGTRSARTIFWAAFLSALAVAAIFAWQRDVFGVVTFLLGDTALLFLFLLKNSKFFSKYYQPSFGNTLIGLSGIIFLLGSIGNLYFYDNLTSFWFGYDTIAHFMIPALFVVMAAMLYELVRLKKGVPGAVEVVLVSALVVVAFSFLWELFEKQSDIWWGTKMFSDPSQPIAIDTADDLVADVYGVFVGGVFIFKNWVGWNKRWLKDKNS